MIPFLAQSLVEISWGHLKQVRPNKELCLETVLFHKYEEPIQKYNQQPKLRNSKTIMGHCCFTSTDSKIATSMTKLLPSPTPEVAPQTTQI